MSGGGDIRKKLVWLCEKFSWCDVVWDFFSIRFIGLSFQLIPHNS